MSNRRIIFEWLRDSLAGFSLFLLAIGVAGVVDAVTPFEYPNLYMLWFMIGMIPFCKFANWRRAGKLITWSNFWAFSSMAAIVAFLPPDLSPFAFAIIVYAMCVGGNWFWSSYSHVGG